MTATILPGIGAVAASTGTSGAPTAGTWIAGSIAMDSGGGLWKCTASGTPGTWSVVGAGGTHAYAQATGVGTTTSTTWTSTITTVGTLPSVSIIVPSSGNIKIFIASYIGPAANQVGLVNFSLSGANTHAAPAGTNNLEFGCTSTTQIQQASTFWYLTGLIAGATTVQMVVETNGGTCTFTNLTLYVEMLP